MAGGLGLRGQFAGHGDTLLALIQRHIAIHLRQRRLGLWQAGLLRHAFIGIGADPVLGHIVGVEIGDAQQIFGARIAAPGGGLNIGHGLRMLAALEQQQSIVVAGLKVTLRGGQPEQLLGLGQVLRHAVAQLIGLAQIEFGVRVALGGGADPFADGGGVILAAPCIDAGLDVGQRGGGAGQRRQHQSGCGQSAPARGKCNVNHVLSLPSWPWVAPMGCGTTRLRGARDRLAAAERIVTHVLATGKTRLAKPFPPYAPVFCQSLEKIPGGTLTVI